MSFSEQFYYKGKKKDKQNIDVIDMILRKIGRGKVPVIGIKFKAMSEGKTLIDT